MCARTKVSRIHLSQEKVEVDFYREDEQTVVTSELAPKATPLQDFVPRGTEPDLAEPRDPDEISEEDDLQELVLTDPLEYEARLSRGELINVEQAQDD